MKTHINSHKIDKCYAKLYNMNIFEPVVQKGDGKNEQRRT